jgi:hypothetical protein
MQGEVLLLERCAALSALRNLPTRAWYVRLNLAVGNDGAFPNIGAFTRVDLTFTPADLGTHKVDFYAYIRAYSWLYLSPLTANCEFSDRNEHG